MDNLSTSWLEEKLLDRKQKHLYRFLRSAEPLPNGHLILDGRDCLNMCSNDYLGIMHRLKVKALAAGSTASRLISGNHESIASLERELAAFHKSEAALVFSNGYMANLSCLTALMSRGDAIYSDKLNHASIIDGARLSEAEHIRYKHSELDHLEFLLKKGNFRRRMIVSDAIFSMDGDRADIDQLLNLSHKYDALLLVDEAHSGGVFGINGQGLLSESINKERGNVIHMGTLSKAYGSYGAYVCADQRIIDYLINFARPLIYSTSLPPVITDLSRQALKLVKRADNERSELKRKSEYFRSALTDLGYDTAHSTSQIIPLMIGQANKAVELSQYLFDNGIAALAIRPPTVPANSARIRFSIMANHDDADLQRAIELIKTYKETHG